MRALPEETVQDLRDTAEVLADVAREETLRYFRKTGLGTQNKARDGYDPVTRADRAAETRMREVLAERRPDDGILGEEFGEKSGRSGLTWVLDPIDGTRGYVAGTPTWGVLIAVSDAAGPILGVVDQPFIAERFRGGPGWAEYDGPHGAHTLATRATAELSDAIIFTTFPEVGTVEEGAAFRAVADQCLLTRYGMDCYAYALLAAGHIDLVIEAGLNAYDIQGPMAVIQAAGGVVTNWEGGACHGGGQVLAAANATLHAKALAILQAAR